MLPFLRGAETHTRAEVVPSILLYSYVCRCNACCYVPAGDSRAVLSRGDVAIPLTDDHKAAREDETVSHLGKLLWIHARASFSCWE